MKERFGEWRLPIRFFNSGLILFQENQLNPEIAEAYEHWHQSIDPSLKQGTAGIWFGDWTPEQSCYHVMMALSEPAPEGLDKQYRLGFHPTVSFNHFLRNAMIRKSTHQRLQPVLNDLLIR